MALQSRADGPGAEPTTRTESWLPEETALIICDMWNLHPCLNATRRGAELCPTMDRLIGRMRAAGATIVHAPSGCMGEYEGTLWREMKAADVNRTVPRQLWRTPKEAQLGALEQRYVEIGRAYWAAAPPELHDKIAVARVGCTPT